MAMHTLVLLLGILAGVAGRMGRRVEVARCRATCLPLTATCWEECEEVREGRSSNRPGRGRAGGRRRHLMFTSTPLLNPSSLSWTSPLPTPNSFSPSSPTSLVYLVMGRDTMGTWLELGQTTLLALSLDPAVMESVVTLRLLAVGKKGVVARATVVPGEDMVVEQEGQEVVVEQKTEEEQLGVMEEIKEQEKHGERMSDTSFSTLLCLCTLAALSLLLTTLGLLKLKVSREPTDKSVYSTYSLIYQSFI